MISINLELILLTGRFRMPVPPKPPRKSPVAPRDQNEPLHQEHSDKDLQSDDRDHSEGEEQKAQKDDFASSEFANCYILYSLYSNVFAAFDATAFLKPYQLTVNDEVVHMLGATYIVDHKPADELSLFSSSSESQPSSTEPSPLKSTPHTKFDKSKAKMAAFRPSVATEPPASQNLQQKFASGISPADMITYLSSPECAFSHSEKVIVYKSILKMSVLAYDADSGNSQFAFVQEAISLMEGQAKEAARIHGEVTVASLCKAFLAQLEASAGKIHIDAVLTMLEEGERGARTAGTLKQLMDFERFKSKDREKRLEMRLRKEFGLKLEEVKQNATKKKERSTTPGATIADPVKLQNIINNNDKEIANKTSEIERLQRKTEKFNEQSTQLKEKTRTVLSQEKEIAKLNELFADEVKLNKLRDEKNNLALENLNARMGEKDSEIAQLKVAIKTLESRVRERDDRIQELEDNTEALESDAAALLAKVKNLEAELETVKKDNEVQCAALAGVSGSISLRLQVLTGLNRIRRP